VLQRSVVHRQVAYIRHGGADVHARGAHLRLDLLPERRATAAVEGGVVLEVGGPDGEGVGRTPGEFTAPVPITPLLLEEKTEEMTALLPLSSRILTAIHWAAAVTPVPGVPSTPLSMMEATTAAWKAQKGA